MLLARQFLYKKLLIQDMEYGSLKLTDNAWDVLKSYGTFVQNIHKYRMMEELNFKTSAQLVGYAIRHGIVTV